MLATTALIKQRIIKGNQPAINEIPQEFFIARSKLLMIAMRFLSPADVQNLIEVSLIYNFGIEKKIKGVEWNKEEQTVYLSKLVNVYRNNEALKKAFIKFDKRQYFLAKSIVSFNAFTAFYGKLPYVDLHERQYLADYRMTSWKQALKYCWYAKGLLFHNETAHEIFLLLLKRNIAKIKMLLSPTNKKDLLATEKMSQRILWMYLHHYANQSLLDYIYDMLEKENDFLGFSPLHAALLCKQSSSVILTLKPNKENIHVCHANSTPFFIAALDNRCDLIELLLKEDRQAYKKTEPLTSHTILHVAAQYGHVELAMLILKHLKENEKLTDDEISAYILLSDKSEHSAWHYTLKSAKTSEIATLLSKYIKNFNGYDIDNTDALEAPLLHAAAHGHPDTVKMLLTKKATTNKISALKEAVGYNRVKNANLLFQDGVKLDARTTNSLYRLPIESQCAKMFALLLKNDTTITQSADGLNRAKILVEVGMSKQGYAGTIREKMLNSIDEKLETLNPDTACEIKPSR